LSGTFSHGPPRPDGRGYDTPYNFGTALRSFFV